MTEEPIIASGLAEPGDSDESYQGYLRSCKDRSIAPHTYEAYRRLESTLRSLYAEMDAIDIESAEWGGDMVRYKSLGTRAAQIEIELGY